MVDALSKVSDDEHDFGECSSSDCQNRLSPSQIADGLIYCSEECEIQSLMYFSDRLHLWDDPEDFEDDDE